MKQQYNNFMILPNNLVWDVSGKENSMIKKYGVKAPYVIMFLMGSVTTFGSCKFSIQEIIEGADMKLDYHDDKSLDIFKNILIKLEEDGIIKDVQIFNGNKNTIKDAKTSDMIKCTFDLPIKQKNSKNTEFFMINNEDIFKIFYNETKNTKITLFNIYSYLVARMRRSEKDADIERDGGKAECTYGTMEDMIKDLNISKDTFNKCIIELKEMGLIFYDNIGSVIKDGKTHAANNVYALNTTNLREGLKESKDWYKSNGYKIGKKVNTLSKQIASKKGVIARLKKNGKDVSKYEKELEELIKKSNANKDIV